MCAEAQSPEGGPGPASLRGRGGRAGTRQAARRPHTPSAAEQSCSPGPLARPLLLDRAAAWKGGPGRPAERTARL